MTTTVGDNPDLGPPGRLDARREILVDDRGGALMATWHADRGVVVVSVWHGNVCAGTVRLQADQAEALASWLAPRSELPGAPELGLRPDAHSEVRDAHPAPRA